MRNAFIAYAIIALLFVILGPLAALVTLVGLFGAYVCYVGYMFEHFAGHMLTINLFEAVGLTASDAIELLDWRQ